MLESKTQYLRSQEDVRSRKYAERMLLLMILPHN